MSEQWRLVFLGGGQMAEAIARGAIAAGLLTPDRIAASEIRPDRRAYLERSVGIKAVATNAEAVALGDVIVLALKPQDIGTVLDEIGELVREDQLVVSIAAGVPLARIEPAFSKPDPNPGDYDDLLVGLIDDDGEAFTGRVQAEVPVIRVMPNTPCLV